MHSLTIINLLLCCSLLLLLSMKALKSSKVMKAQRGGRSLNELRPRLEPLGFPDRSVHMSLRHPSVLRVSGACLPHLWSFLLPLSRRAVGQLMPERQAGILRCHPMQCNATDAACLR
jgi:hypothetical protein